jgi:hypothetical protein
MKVRVKELVWCKGKDLVPHSKNWRNHPLRQVDAFKGLLNEIGFADVLLGYTKTDGTIGIIDGHMRAGLLPEEELPVVLLDLTDEEAEVMLASADGLAMMAEIRGDQLEGLLRSAKKSIKDIYTKMPDFDMVLNRARATALAAPPISLPPRKPIHAVCPACGKEFET